MYLDHDFVCEGYLVRIRHSGSSPDWSARLRIAGNRHGLADPSDLTDAEWIVLEPIMRERTHRGSRRRTDIRLLVNAVLLILATGRSLRTLPPGAPPRSTVAFYFDTWSEDGTLGRIHAALFKSS